MNRLYANALLAIGLMGFFAVLFQPPADRSAAPAASAHVRGERSATGENEDEALLLTRNSSGQFYMQGSVNGSDVRFLVDTGADMVALTEATAQDLGLSVGEMEPIMQTASGVGYGTPVMLDEVVIGGETLTNVEAVVVQDLSTDLLGQSVLRRLGSVSLQGDRMIIRPR